jgi:hypothetical protein
MCRAILNLSPALISLDDPAFDLKAGLGPPITVCSVSDPAAPAMTLGFVAPQEIHSPQRPFRLPQHAFQSVGLRITSRSVVSGLRHVLPELISCRGRKGLEGVDT